MPPLRRLLHRQLEHRRPAVLDLHFAPRLVGRVRLIRTRRSCFVGANLFARGGPVTTPAQTGPGIRLVFAHDIE